MGKAILLTKGSIPKSILLFSIPIFIGQLFQQLYSIVDSLVVGNFVGDDALGAVSATGSLSFLFTGLVSGIFLGAGVLISKYFGANDKESVSKAIHTSVAFSIICGILLTIVGIVITPSILRLMGTPDNIINDSILYLRIIFAGAIFTAGYNCASGIYQAVGNTKSPLYFLIISSILNVILNIIFIVVFKLGVSGAAYATIIGQAVSMILAFIFLFKTNQIYKLNVKDIKFHKGFILDIIKYGLPAGIQNSVISLANVVVQSNINIFGSAAIAGVGAYVRIEGIVFIPISSFAFALTTSISQNLGAKEYQRVKSCSIFGMVTPIAISVVLGLLFILFGPQLLSLFSRDPEVIKYGMGRVLTSAPFYFLLAFANGAAGILRGAGKSLTPMLVLLACWCVIRVLFIQITMYFINDINVVFWAYPLTWGLSCLLFTFLLKFSNWTNES